jgi:hypothetical protein
VTTTLTETDIGCPVIEVRSKGPSTVGMSPHSPEDKTDPVSKTVVFSSFRIRDDRQSPKNPLILSVIHHHSQNILESNGIHLVQDKDQCMGGNEPSASIKCWELVK